MRFSDTPLEPSFRLARSRIAFAAFLLLVARGLAAESPGRIAGYIVDAQGSPVAGATLQLSDLAGNVTREEKSDSSGSFDLGQVTGGSYHLSASATGFEPINAEVAVSGQAVRLWLQFHRLLAGTQMVTVTATSPHVLQPDESARTFSRDETLDANPGRPGAPISIPGLPIETASGGIKAPQYFAPGVAGDHGEPIAQYFQIGDFLVPNNLPANAHGNGYADPNVLIPAAISGVQADGGAFNAREGDHAVDLAATYDVRPRLNSFAQVTGDDRDADVIAGWGPWNASVNEWLALEVAFGNGFLTRLEHRHQYKLNGYREFKAGRHDLSTFGSGYYGFSRLPGLIPIGVPVLDDTVDYRQLDRTHNFLAVVTDTYQPNASTQFLFSGFLRDYDLTLQSNFGDGLIQQRENRTVAGGEGASIVKLGHGLSLLAGADLRRDAPRNLDLKHLDAAGLFDLVTSNNFTFSFAEPFVALDGSLGHHVRFDVGTRQEEIGINNQDLLNPANSFGKVLSVNMPKVSVTFTPGAGSPLPSLTLSAAEAFHTDDPRISTDSGMPGPPNLLTTSRAYRATLQKNFGRTQMRLILSRVANSEETANIDPDTGLEQYVGPSLDRALTVEVDREFGRGGLIASFSRADARDRLTGQPVPEAPRLIWDLTGRYDRLPLHIGALGELSYVGAKPLDDGITGLRVREFRGSLHRRFAEDRMTAALDFLWATGHTGQTVEALALLGDTSPFARVGVPLKSYVAMSWTYNFGH